MGQRGETVFEGISGSGWLVIGCALALGFGVIRFLIVNVEDRRSGLPQGPVSADAKPWHEVLGVPADADWPAIQAACARCMEPYSAARMEGLGPDFVKLAAEKSAEIERALAQGRAQADASRG